MDYASIVGCKVALRDVVDSKYRRVSEAEKGGHRHPTPLFTPRTALCCVLLCGRMRFDDVFGFNIVCTWKHDHDCMCLPVNTAHTFEHKRAFCCHKGPEFGARVLLYGCCIAAVSVVCTAVAARLFFETSRRCGFVSSCPLSSIQSNAPLDIMCSFLFPRSTGNIAHTDAPAVATTK